jgi:hypothetical protein
VTRFACQISAERRVSGWHFASGGVSLEVAGIPVPDSVCPDSGLPVISWRGGGIRVRAQYRPYTCCQDHNEKSCKRVSGAIPIALRSELGIELSLSFWPVCVILAYTGRPGVQNWRVLEKRCG